MNQLEALEAIETGHVIWAVSHAKAVCETLGVPFAESLVEIYESERHPLGVTMLHGPDQGVWSLDLARHVAECLGVAKDAHRYIGRGSQAQEYARVVAARLGLKPND